MGVSRTNSARCVTLDPEERNRGISIGMSVHTASHIFCLRRTLEALIKKQVDVGAFCYGGELAIRFVCLGGIFIRHIQIISQ